MERTGAKIFRFLILKLCKKQKFSPNCRGGHSGPEWRHR